MSGNAIETVSINNNGAVVFSSQHEPKGSSPKESNLVYLIPHAIICPEEEPLKKEEEGELSKTLEKMSPALSGILDYEADVSLEKINPITQNGQHKT